MTGVITIGPVRTARRLPAAPRGAGAQGPIGAARDDSTALVDDVECVLGPELPAAGCGRL